MYINIKKENKSITKKYDKLLCRLNMTSDEFIIISDTNGTRIKCFWWKYC